MEYRVCRDCGEEFRPEFTRCSDCGGDLVHPAEEANVPPDSFSATEDLGDFRPIFVGGQAALLVPLAEALRSQGISFRLAEELANPERGTASFSLLVAEADRAAALRALGPLLGEEAGPGRLTAVESHFGESGRYHRCPACDVEVAFSATECPECGLVIGDGGGPS